jgi:hypothetical protein
MLILLRVIPYTLEPYAMTLIIVHLSIATLVWVESRGGAATLSCENYGCGGAHLIRMCAASDTPLQLYFNFTDFISLAFCVLHRCPILFPSTTRYVFRQRGRALPIRV